MVKNIASVFLDTIVFMIFILGVILVAVSYISARKGSEKRSEMDPCTEVATATVTHLNIFTEKLDKDDDLSPTRYLYDARYNFEVDGQEYTGNYSSYSKINEGDTFEIMYDPNNPSRCFTVKEMSKKPNGDIKKNLFFYPGVVMVALGLLAAIPLTIIKIVARAKAKKRRKEEFERAM